MGYLSYSSRESHSLPRTYINPTNKEIDDLLFAWKVAKHTKDMPQDFLDETKPYVTNNFFEYAMPLTGGIEPKTQIFV